MPAHEDGNKNAIGLSHIVTISPANCRGRAVANHPMPNPLPAASANDHRIATLHHLHRRARQVGSCAELDFFAVNDSHELAPYMQSVLLLEGEVVTTLSGVATPEANAPYGQ